MTFQSRGIATGPHIYFGHIRRVAYGESFESKWYFHEKQFYLLSFCKCIEEVKMRKAWILFALHAERQLLADFRFRNLLVLWLF